MQIWRWGSKPHQEKDPDAVKLQLRLCHSATFERSSCNLQHSGPKDRKITWQIMTSGVPNQQGTDMEQWTCCEIWWILKILWEHDREIQGGMASSHQMHPSCMSEGSTARACGIQWDTGDSLYLGARKHKNRCNFNPSPQPNLSTESICPHAFFQWFAAHSQWPQPPWA